MHKYEGNKLFKILNEVSDWIIRIVIVNFLTILTMLPIITIIPSLTSAYKIMSDALYKDEAPIFTVFYKTFKEEFTKKLLISIVFVLIIAFSVYNNYLYGIAVDEGKGLFYYFGYYITLIIIISSSMIAMYLPVVFIEKKEETFKELIKTAFYLSGKYFLRTFLIALVLIIPVMMFISPVTMFLFVFIGISIPMLLIALITKKPRDFLKEITNYA